MQGTHAPAVQTVDVDAVPFRIDPLDHPDLDNVVVSPCGTYYESFDFNGEHFAIDLLELIGDDDEEEIPHEQVMEEMRLYCEELAARRKLQP